MRTSTITDEKGRHYEAFVTETSEMAIIIGPPEGLVDELGLPEPFATRLHNALHQRGLLNYQQAAKHSKELQGVVQEVLLVEAQKLLEAYFKYNQEAHHE